MNKQKILLVGSLVMVSVLAILSVVIINKNFEKQNNIKEIPLQKEVEKQKNATPDALQGLETSETKIDVKNIVNPEIDLSAVETYAGKCLAVDFNCFLSYALISGNKDYCNRINSDNLEKGDYKNFCLGIVDKNLSKCQLSDGKSGAGTLSTLCSAIVKNDYGTCASGEIGLLGERGGENCKGMVIHYNNLASKNFFYPDRYCARNEYKKRDFVAAFLYENIQQCYIEAVSYIIKYGLPVSYNESICAVLNTNPNNLNNKDNCYITVALEKRDVKICGKVVDTALKNKCAQTISENSKIEKVLNSFKSLW